MKKNLELVRHRLDISGKALFGVAVFSAVFIAGCFAMLTPAFRNIIIAAAEYFLSRQIHRHDVWLNLLFQWGIIGIIIYGVFFLAFFAKDIFRRPLSKKQAWLFLAAFTALGVFAIMFRADWSFGDDHQFIITTAVNKYVPLYIIPAIGRFFPLGLTHYNLPLFVFRLLGINSGLPAAAHYALIALFFAITVVCLYVLFGKIAEKTGGQRPLFTLFFACTFFMAVGSILGVFMSLIYPETQIIMLAAVFMLAFYHARETNKKRYYIAALVSAVYASYCKEPVSGAFVVFAAANCIFNFKNQSKREKLFHAALVLNGILFMLLYYFLAYRNAVGFYNEGRTAGGALKFVVLLFVKNPVLIPVYIFGFARLIAVIFKKDRAHIFCDTLLFAGMAYIFAYMLLRLDGEYYFTPAIILSLPSLVFWTGAVYKKNKNRALAVFGLLLLLYTFNGRGAAGIAGTYRGRKELMPYIDRLLSEYRAGKKFIWYESDNALSDNTFYIAVRDWRKYTENAFLNFQNGTEGKEFFTVSRDIGAIDFDDNTLFFYPLDNDQKQPMPESLSDLLREKGFELVTDAHDVLIYQCQPSALDRAAY